MDELVKQAFAALADLLGSYPPQESAMQFKLGVAMQACRNVADAPSAKPKRRATPKKAASKKKKR